MSMDELQIKSNEIRRLHSVIRELEAEKEELEQKLEKYENAEYIKNKYKDINYDDLKSCIVEFYRDNNTSIKKGDFSIGVGGYDNYWTIYYKNVPIIENINNEVNIISKKDIETLSLSFYKLGTILKENQSFNYKLGNSLSFVYYSEQLEAFEYIRWSKFNNPEISKNEMLENVLKIYSDYDFDLSIIYQLVDKHCDNFNLIKILGDYTNEQAIKFMSMDGIITDGSFDIYKDKKTYERSSR